MEKLYGVEELAQRWHCKERTARERMRKIGTIGRPMMCRESAIVAYERSIEEAPAGTRSGSTRRKRRGVIEINQGPLKPGQIISRVRPKREGRGA